MTNCDYTRHQGPKGPKDLSICLNTFRAITSEEWLKMCDVTGSALSEANTKNEIIIKPSSDLTHQELRDLRIAYYLKNATV